MSTVLLNCVLELTCPRLVLGPSVSSPEPQPEQGVGHSLSGRSKEFVLVLVGPTQNQTKQYQTMLSVESFGASMFQVPKHVHMQLCSHTCTPPSLLVLAHIPAGTSYRYWSSGDKWHRDCSHPRSSSSQPYWSSGNYSFFSNPPLEVFDDFWMSYMVDEPVSTPQKEKGRSLQLAVKAKRMNTCEHLESVRQLTVKRRV